MLMLVLGMVDGPRFRTYREKASQPILSAGIYMTDQERDSHSRTQIHDGGDSDVPRAGIRELLWIGHTAGK